MSNHSLKEICKFNTSNDYDSFVGLRIIDNSPVIYLPLGYNYEDDITTKDIDNLITGIKRFSLKNNDYYDINDIHSNEDKFPYFSYKWIIENYLEYGYYNEIEYTEEVGNNGKINWKRTISKTSDIFTKKGPVYTNFIIRKSRINDSNLLTRIHEFCVYESYQKLGWLFDNKSSAKKPILYIDEKNKNKFISILNEELKNSFKDSKKELIENMIKVLIGLDDIKHKKRSFECGTTKYYHVWEKMIDIAFSNVKNIENYYPHGEWHIKNQSKKNSALQPDTIVRDNNNVYIYDSKYYTYCNSQDVNNLPTTDSIQKQITYAEYVDKKYNPNNIYNAFVMPGNISDKIEYVGFATADWKENDKLYHKIHTFMIDTKYIINNYNKKPVDLIKVQLDNIGKNY